MPAEHARRVRPGGGVIRPTVILDGRAVATWRIDRSRKLRVVVVEPFDPLDSELRVGLEGEVADIGRFLGAGFALRVDRPSAVDGPGGRGPTYH